MRHGIYPKVSFLTLLKAPIHMVNFGLIMQMSRNVANPNHADLAANSFLWISNPCLADPTGALPIMFAAIMMTNIKLGQGRMAEDRTKASVGIMRKVFVCLPAITIPLTM